MYLSLTHSRAKLMKLIDSECLSVVQKSSYLIGYSNKYLEELCPGQSSDGDWEKIHAAYAYKIEGN